MTRYFIGFLVTIGLIILVIVLLLSGGSKKPPVTAKALSSYSNTDAQVRLTVTGPITAPVNHNEFSITVGRDQSTFKAYQGYDGDEINNRSYDNTENSYYSFLRALSFAGFTKGNTSKDFSNSTGICPTGEVYTFEIIDSGKVLQHFWSTSCNGTKSFGGNTTLNLTLFQAQIPDFADLRSQITTF